MRYLLALLVAGALSAPPLARVGQGWSELRTANFHVIGNVDHQKSVEIGTGLERLRQALDVWPGNLDQTPRRPLTIYVFRDRRSSRGLLPAPGLGDRPGGLFFRDPDAAHVAVHADRGFDTAAITYHEYLHYLIEENLPTAPLWLGEGLAEVFTTFRATPHEAEVGLPIQSHVDIVRGGRLFPMEALSGIVPTSREYREPRRKLVFHAQAWALTHYLMFGPDHAGGFGTSIARLRRGEPSSAVFPALEGGMPAGLLAHLETAATRTARIDLPTIASDGYRPRPLARDEALRCLGDLLLHQPPKRREAARKLYAKAIELNDGNARAHTGLGLLAALEGRGDEALRRLRRGSELAPDDGRVQFFLARQLLHPVSRRAVPVDASGESPRLTEIRRLLDRAVEADPGHVEPRIALGLTWSLIDPAADQGPAELEQALRQDPSRDDALFYLYRLRLLRGEAAEAEALERRIAARARPFWVARAREAREALAGR